MHIRKVKLLLKYFSFYKSTNYDVSLFRVFRKRKGLGNFIAKKLALFSGVPFNYKAKNLPITNFNEDLIYILSAKNKNDYLDGYVRREIEHAIDKYFIVYNYRADRYINKLPLNGQRRRTNANTCKKVRPYTIKNN